MKIDRARLFDLRVVQRNIRSGRVQKDEYGAWLSALPDATPKIKPREEGGDEDGYDGHPPAPAPAPAPAAAPSPASALEAEPAHERVAPPVAPVAERPEPFAPSMPSAPAPAPAPVAPSVPSAPSPAGPVVAPEPSFGEPRGSGEPGSGAGG